MKDLWTYCNRRYLRKKKVYQRFLVWNTLIWCLVGLFAWCAIRMFALDSILWMICFIGYSGCFMGLFRGIFYIMNVEKCR